MRMIVNKSGSFIANIYDEIDLHLSVVCIHLFNTFIHSIRIHHVWFYFYFFLLLFTVFFHHFLFHVQLHSQHVIQCNHCAMKIVVNEMKPAFIERHTFDIHFAQISLWLFIHFLTVHTYLLWWNEFILEDST